MILMIEFIYITLSISWLVVTACKTYKMGALDAFNNNRAILLWIIKQTFLIICFLCSIKLSVEISRIIFTSQIGAFLSVNSTNNNIQFICGLLILLLISSLTYVIYWMLSKLIDFIMSKIKSKLNKNIIHNNG